MDVNLDGEFVVGEDAWSVRAVGPMFFLGLPMGLQVGLEVWGFTTVGFLMGYHDKLVGLGELAGASEGIKALAGHQVAMNLAALAFMDTDGLQARVLSGSENQSRNLYDYWRRWCGTKDLAPRLSGPVRRGATRVAGGRLEILSASQRDVRGPKIHHQYEDELDEINPEIDAAAVGMISSSPGIPGRTVYTSTWHRTDGPMARLVEGSPANGVSLHKWNIWEAIQKCPPDRHRNGGGCDHCPLGGPCVAKAREHHNDPQRSGGIAAEACAEDQARKALLRIAEQEHEHRAIEQALVESPPREVRAG